MAVSKLQERAAVIAAKFVQTVVLIDDEAFDLLKRTDSGKIQKAEINEPAMLPADQDAVEEAPKGPLPETTPPKLKFAEVETAAVGKVAESASQPHALKEAGAAAVQSAELDAVLASGEKAVTTGFDDATPADVAQGINAKKLVTNFARIGLVCGIIEPDPDASDLDSLLTAAMRSDVIIVDWIFNKDNGRTAKKIIASVLSTDAQERLRLIVVYTGDPGNDKIVDEIKKSAGVILTSIERNVLANEHTRIAVLSKVSSSRSKTAVTLEELPKRVLEEFAALYSGLITMAAVDGLSALRSNTHQLLGRLHRKLDTAFLAHRMLLPQPEDSQEFLTELVGQEITALLHDHEIGNASDISTIEAWFEDQGTTMPKHAAELTDKVGQGEDVRRALVRNGVTAFLANRAQPDKHRDLEKEIHKAASKLFMNDQAKADLSDQEFAHVCSMVGRYTGAKMPRLNLGTVLLMDEAEYLVCVQPLCDCMRLKAPRRFIFLTGKKDNSNPNLVIQHGGKIVRVKVAPKVPSLVQHEFAPTHGKDVVYASENEQELIFESTAKTKFIWRGQLKFPQAQRLAQQFSANLARIGLDESEWLRRLDVS